MGSTSNVSTARRLGKKRRHFRVRKKVTGTVARPRLVVTRSTRHITAQVVDDTAGHTLAYASSMEGDLRGAEGDKSEVARQVGARVAARAKEAGIEAVVFDRGGSKYHGRIAALADGARQSGLAF